MKKAEDSGRALFALPDNLGSSAGAQRRSNSVEALRLEIENPRKAGHVQSLEALPSSYNSCSGPAGGITGPVHRVVAAVELTRVSSTTSSLFDETFVPAVVEGVAALGLRKEHEPKTSGASVTAAEGGAVVVARGSFTSTSDEGAKEDDRDHKFAEDALFSATQGLAYGCIMDAAFAVKHFCGGGWLTLRGLRAALCILALGAVACGLLFQFRRLADSALLLSRTSGPTDTERPHFENDKLLMPSPLSYTQSGVPPPSNDGQLCLLPTDDGYSMKDNGRTSPSGETSSLCNTFAFEMPRFPCGESQVLLNRNLPVLDQLHFYWASSLRRDQGPTTGLNPAAAATEERGRTPLTLVAGVEQECNWGPQTESYQPSGDASSGVRESHRRRVDTARSLTTTLDGYRPADALLPMEMAPVAQYDGHLSHMIYVHTWHSGPLFSGFQMLLWSMIATQDMRSSKFIIWMDEDWETSSDLSKQAIVRQFRFTPHRFVEFRLLEVNRLAMELNSCWARRPEFLLKKPLVDIVGMAFYADIVRLLLLASYGGLWLDSDNLALVPYRWLYDVSPFGVVASKVFQTGEATPTYNNHFLFVAGKSARLALLELSCQFRLVPSNKPRYNYSLSEMENIDFQQKWDWTTIVPLDAHGRERIVLLHGWLWNDGVLQMCQLNPKRCPMLHLELRYTDPAWLLANEMESLCESPSRSLHDYFHFYREAFPQVAAQGIVHGSQSYLDAVDHKLLIPVLHTRANQCRNYGTRNAGEYRNFENWIKQTVGGDSRWDPMPAVWLLYDVLSAHPRDVERQQLTPKLRPPRDLLTIIVPSLAAHFQARQRLRLQMTRLNTLWFPERCSRRSETGYMMRALPECMETKAGPSSRTRLLFAVSIPYDNDNQIGALLQENARFGDVMLVGPLNVETVNGGSAPSSSLKFDASPPPEESAPNCLNPSLDAYVTPYLIDPNYRSSAILPSVLELAVLKWAAHFDSSYILLLYQQPFQLATRRLAELIRQLDETPAALGHHNIRPPAKSTPPLLVAITAAAAPSPDASSGRRRREAVVQTALGPVDTERGLRQLQVHIGHGRVTGFPIREQLEGVLVARELLPVLLNPCGPVASSYRRRLRAAMQYQFCSGVNCSHSETDEKVNRMAARQRQVVESRDLRQLQKHSLYALMVAFETRSTNSGELFEPRSTNSGELVNDDDRLNVLQHFRFLTDPAANKAATIAAEAGSFNDAPIGIPYVLGRAAGVESLSVGLMLPQLQIAFGPEYVAFIAQKCNFQELLLEQGVVRQQVKKPPVSFDSPEVSFVKSAAILRYRLRSALVLSLPGSEQQPCLEMELLVRRIEEAAA